MILSISYISMFLSVILPYEFSLSMIAIPKCFVAASMYFLFLLSKQLCCPPSVFCWSVAWSVPLLDQELAPMPLGVFACSEVASFAKLFAHKQLGKEVTPQKRPTYQEKAKYKRVSPGVLRLMFATASDQPLFNLRPWFRLSWSTRTAFAKDFRGFKIPSPYLYPSLIIS